LRNRQIKQVGIVGAGQWGTTLAWLCSLKCEDVRLYDYKPERAKLIQQTRKNKDFTGDFEIPGNVSVHSDLEHVIGSAQIILVVVPSQSMRATAKAISQFCTPSQYLVHGTKGLEQKTHKRMSEVLLEETACLRVGVLSGPNLADEILNGLPAASVIASRFDEVIEGVQNLLSSPRFLVFGNHDIVGVEWVGTLKNILALATGMIHELKLGQNTQALILTRGIAEIELLFKKLGASSETLLGLAGLGDIFATCTSQQSRNFRAGVLLAQGQGAVEVQNQVHATVEGLHTIRAVLDFKDEHKLDLPIIEALGRCAFQGKGALDEVQKILARIPGLEKVV